MDNDPFSPVGIAAPTMRFLDMFLLYCLLGDSPPDTPEEIAAMSRNQHRVAESGRDPGLLLECRGQEQTLQAWGRDLLREFEPIAAALDQAHAGGDYRDALSEAAAALAQPASTRSARVLEEMQHTPDKSYVAFALAQSAQHRRSLMELPLSLETKAQFARMAQDSLAAQAKIEAADSVPFEAYRQEYLSRDLLSGALLQSMR
jgi:glutamate--cysteine ligase